MKSYRFNFLFYFAESDFSTFNLDFGPQSSIAYFESLIYPKLTDTTLEHGSRYRKSKKWKMFPSYPFQKYTYEFSCRGLIFELYGLKKSIFSIFTVGGVSKFSDEKRRNF